MYQSSAHFSSRFGLKSKSCKTIDLVFSTKCVFALNSVLGAAARQSSPPLGWAPVLCLGKTLPLYIILIEHSLLYEISELAF